MVYELSRANLFTMSLQYCLRHQILMHTGEKIHEWARQRPQVLLTTETLIGGCTQELFFSPLHLGR